MVLNSASKGSALSGGGACINDIYSIGLYQNEWSSNSARTGSGAVNFQSVHDGVKANETFYKYDLPRNLPRDLEKSSSASKSPRM